MKKFIGIVAIILVIVLLLLAGWTYLYGNDMLPKPIKEWVTDHPKIDELSKAMVRHAFFTTTYESLKEDYEIISSTPDPATDSLTVNSPTPEASPLAGE